LARKIWARLTRPTVKNKGLLSWSAPSCGLTRIYNEQNKNFVHNNLYSFPIEIIPFTLTNQRLEIIATNIIAKLQ